MNKLTFLVLVFTIITTAYVQDVTNTLVEQSPLIDDQRQTKEVWIQQIQGLRRNGKPCARRRSNNPDGAWIPSYSSKMSHPIPTVLQPQALKNEEQPQELKHEEQKTPTENEYILESEQRSLSDQEPSRRNNFADDCVDQLEQVDVGSQAHPNAEKTALKIIEDCLKKKKDQPLGSSRRSMSDTEQTYDDENGEPREPDHETEENTKKADENNDEGDARRSHAPKKNAELLQNGKTNLNNLRICYACSTATNPTCWEPNSKTTIKYCRKEQSCVTKTFGVKNQLTLIRDCANTCADTSVPGIEPKYKTCKICHKDYCNSAMNIALNSYNFAIILIISVCKYAY